MKKHIGWLNALLFVMILCGRFQASAQPPIELTAQAEDYLVKMPVADYRLIEVRKAGETFTRVVADGLVDYGNIGQAMAVATGNRRVGDLLGTGPADRLHRRTRGNLRQLRIQRYSSNRRKIAPDHRVSGGN